MVLSVSAVRYRKNISLIEGLLPSKFFALHFFNLVTVDAVFSEIDFQGLDSDTRGVPATSCSKHKCLVVFQYITIFILIITIFLLIDDRALCMNYFITPTSALF